MNEKARDEKKERNTDKGETEGQKERDGERERQKYKGNERERDTERKQERDREGHDALFDGRTQNDRKREKTVREGEIARKRRKQR